MRNSLPKLVALSLMILGIALINWLYLNTSTPVTGNITVGNGGYVQANEYEVQCVLSDENAKRLVSAANRLKASGDTLAAEVLLVTAEQRFYVDIREYQKDGTK